VVEEEKEDPDMLELVAQCPAEVEAEDDEEAEVLPPRRSTWISGGISRPSCYAMASIKVKRTEGQDEARNAEIKQAEIAKIELVFINPQALQPVQPKEMGEFEPLKSHMFSGERFTVEGEFDKVKARMVANGNEQDPSQYPDKSSPTVAVHSILSCLTMVAYFNSFKMAKIDVKWAFNKMEMKDPPVYIKYNMYLMKLIMQTLPGL
jgi:hypothetical protein